MIATKFGFDILPNGQRGGGLNSKAEHIKQLAEASLNRLNNLTALIPTENHAVRVPFPFSFSSPG